MALNSEPLPARRAPIQWPRLSLAPGVIFNRISRRALVIAAVTGGIVPTWAIIETSGTSAALYGWLALYTLSALLWLKDATTQWPTYLRRTGPLATLPLPSDLIAGLHGAACGAALLIHIGTDAVAPRMLLQTLHVSIVLAVVAASLKKPSSSAWFARLCLAVDLLGWVAGGHPDKALLFVQLATTWAFAEILARRNGFLKRRFSQMATRHGNAVSALRLKARELHESTTSRVRILGTVSHEVRQPVHALGMMVERLRIDPQSLEFRPQIDEIASVVRSLAHSLALLLDINRLDAGTVNVKKSTTGIQVLLERLTREFAVDARRKGLTLECHSDLNVRVETDFALFYGAVANFVSNAIRYTDRGYVKVFTSAKGPDEIWLHIRDSGRGISQDKVKDIFEEYVRLDRENQAAQGFGLGLAIVRRTAHLLGLQIEVDSQIGVGSEFRISVPCFTETQANAAASSVVARQSTVSRSLVGLRVVLVDNDASVLRGIDSIVRSWGCVPLACLSVDELAEKLQHMPGADFDCIVADFHLGAGQPNGLAAIELVREHMQKFVSATIFTGDLSIRSADLPVPDVHVAHKPVVPARICVMFEEMSAETKRRRPAGDAEEADEAEAALDEETLTGAMPLASAYSLSDPPLPDVLKDTPSPHHESQPDTPHADD